MRFATGKVLGWLGDIRCEVLPLVLVGYMFATVELLGSVLLFFYAHVPRYLYIHT